jgi:glyceraldehyde-3-phosphate dehydrogenase (NADP+)
VFSTISSREKYEPTILGSIPFMGEKKAWGRCADAAFNNGQSMAHHESGWSY